MGDLYGIIFIGTRPGLYWTWTESVQTKYYDTWHYRPHSYRLVDYHSPGAISAWKHNCGTSVDYRFRDLPSHHRPGSIYDYPGTRGPGETKSQWRSDRGTLGRYHTHQGGIFS